MSNPTVGRLAWVILLGAISAGCNKTAGLPTYPGVAKAPVAKTNSVWAPDPGWAGEFTQSLSFDKYQLSGPKNLAVDPEGTKPVGAMNQFSWAIDSGTDVAKALLIAVVSEDKKLVDEARKNMKQALVNFTAGVTNPFDLQPRRTTEPETGSLGGIPFTRYKWTAATKTRTRLEGLSYGGVDGGRSVLFVAMGFGQDADTNLALMQAVIATFKKQ